MAQSAKLEQDLAQLRALHDQGLLPEAAYEAALAALEASGGEAASRPGEAYPPGLSPDGLPSYLAQPFQAYWAETHARVKLHWLVDTAEVALRWSVAVALAEVLHAGGGALPGALVWELRQHIERPTLGRWLGILRTLSARPPGAARLAPAVFLLYGERFAPAFRTEAEGGTAEDSLLVLRNHLAHGGGLSTREAERLLAAHEERFVALLGAVAAVTEGLTVVVRTADGARRLQGLTPAPMPVPESLADMAEGTWLVGAGGALALLPLLGFGAVTRSGPSGLPETTADGPAAQIYARAERERLVYTPLGVDAPVAESAQVAAFRALFRLDEAAPKASATVEGYAWDGFLGEARVLGEELIGRRAELKALKGWLKGRDTRQAGVAGLGWVYGGPGLGKSLLMARLAADAGNAPAARQGLYYHRFRAGDARNSRRAFLRGLQAALCAWAPLERLEPPAEEADEGPKLEADVRARLAAVAELPPPNDKAPPPRFLILVDGLDECAAHEATLPRLLRELTLPGTLWLVAGRPAQGLPEAFAPPACAAVFPEGLPPMAGADIRAMLLEGLGHAGHALVARDEDSAEGVSNPFVEAVVERAAGLPLYVHLVIEDLRRGVLTVEDEAQLPVGLTAYYNALLARLGVSDVQRDLTLIAALLACAEEPLTESDLAVLIPGHPSKAARFAPRIAQALAAGRALLRPALTPRGEPAYALYHHSFREHVLATETLAGSVEEAREHLCQLAEAWQRLPAGNLRRHLFRWGTEYALAWQGEEGVAAAHQRLTDFAYLQARLRDLPEPADGTDLAHEYTGLLKHLPAGESHQSFRLWKSFFRERVHILRRGNEYWPAYKILLQLAVEHADDSPVTQAAEAWLAQGHCDWVWLKNPVRPTRVSSNACLGILEGHTHGVIGAVPLPEGKLLSWSSDHTLRIWDGISGECPTVLIGHSDWVLGAIILPDGELLSWSKDATLRVWDPSRGDCLTVFSGHNDRVAGAIPLSADQVVSWACDGTLYVWDTATGECSQTLTEDQNDVCGALRLKNDRVVFWLQDGRLRIWNTRSGACEGLLQGLTCRIRGVLELPDGRLLAWSKDDVMHIWDLSSPEALTNEEAEVYQAWFGTELIFHPTQELEGHEGGIVGALATPGGKIISWSEDATLRAWDSLSGVCTAVLTGHLSPVSDALLLSGNQVVSWCNADSTPKDGTLADHALRIWDYEEGTCLAVLKGHYDSPMGALLLPNGYLLSYSFDRSLRIWDPIEGTCVNALNGHGGVVIGALNLDSDKVVSWGIDGALRVWSSKQRRRARGPERHDGPIWGLRQLEDGGIFTWSSDGKIRVWDAKQAACTSVLIGHEGGVRDAVQLADGRLASCAEDATVRLWDIHTGECVAVLSGRHSGPVNGLLQLPDGQLLSWASDGTLCLWYLDGQSCRRSIAAPACDILAAISLGDGRILADCASNELRIWDLNSPGEPLILEGHEGHIRGTALLPDAHVLSWSHDATLRIWDPTYGECLRVLRGHTHWVLGARVLSEGRLLSWSADQTARLWDVSTGAQLDVFPSERLAVTRDWLIAGDLVDGRWAVLSYQTFAEVSYCQEGPISQVRWHSNGCQRAVLTDEGILAVANTDHTVCFLRLCAGSGPVDLREAEHHLLLSATTP